ncbi:MAG: cupin domain-containing protein [Alphaproteobacteria bacterium]|nr:cupin domain-containing protein [Alphaproteobacteria bacterium]
MSSLTIYDDQVRTLAHHTDADAIREALAGIGVGFERWAADRVLSEGAGQEEVLQAYAASVDRLKAEHGFVTADVIRMKPDHPERATLRAKFLDEHTHADPEVRFFVEGRGQFVLHPDERVFSLVAEAGDLVFVPAGARHWFDMGERPSFCAIRIFSDPAGWVAAYTGDAVAERYPRLST